MQIQNYWVDIENSSGARVGAGPLRASQFDTTDKLSACGEFSFIIAASDPNLGALAEKRVAICKYVDLNGAVHTFGGGVIDKIERTINDDGRMEITVSGNNLARELSYRSVGALDLSGVGGAGVADAPNQIMALAPAGWTINDGTTVINTYTGYNGESVLSALAGVGEYIGEHWRLGSGRAVDWLGPASTFVASGIRAMQHVNDPVSAETAADIALITSFREISDAAELLTRVIPHGAGNGGVVLTLASITDSAPTGYTVDAAANYLKRDASETAYGRIERTLDFKDIAPLSNTTADIQAAANMLLQACAEHLRRYGDPQKFYEIGLSKVDQVLQVGTTLRAVYRLLADGAVVYDLNNDFNIIQVQNQISAEGIHTTGVMISTIDRLPQSDNEFLAATIQASRIVAAKQQLGASVDSFTYRDELDNSKSASFRFWTGDEYTSIQSALLRFRIQPLRSTVKSVAGESTTTVSGGGSTTTSGGGSTSGSGGDSSLTSASGGSTTPTSGTQSNNHAHGLSINSGTITYDVGLSSLGALVASGGWGGGTNGSAIQDNDSNHTHNVTVPSHTHGVTVPSHTHSTPNHSHDTPNHTHDLTPNITMEYGIFEESAGNTLELANLVVKLNSGADLIASVVDIGSGWYELDITDPLTDVVFRPSQTNNEITITTATAKTARIEAQLTIRGVVQAVAYG